MEEENLETIQLEKKKQSKPKSSNNKNCSQEKHKSSCESLEKYKSGCQNQGGEDDQKYVPKKFNPEQKKCFIDFVENLLVFVLPCFIGFGHVGFVVNFAFALMLVRLGLVLKHCQLFSKW